MMIAKLKKKLLINNVFQAICGILGLIIAFGEYDDFSTQNLPPDKYMYFFNICMEQRVLNFSPYKCRYEESSKGTILRVMNSAVTFILGIF